MRVASVAFLLAEMAYVGWSGYTLEMDSIRFGRALGFGARQAVKTLVSAADAATAESPAAKAAPGPRANRPPAAAAQTKATAAGMVEKATKTVAQAREVKQGIRRGGRRFGEAVWSPFVKLSGVLWLEVTGVFFGIFAMSALGAIWRWRSEWHAPGIGRQHLVAAAAMAAVFGYFCVSSFVRAARRGRG